MKTSTHDDDPLRAIFAKCKGAFVTAAVFSFVVNLMILVMPLYMFSLFDRVMGSGNLFTLTMLFIMAMTALLVQALVDIARTYLFVQMSAWIDRQIGYRLLDISIDRSLPRGNPHTTELLSKLNGLRGFLAGQQVYTLMDAPWVPVFIGVLFLLNVWIGVTALGIAILLGILAVVNKMITNPALEEAGKAAGAASRIANGTVQNADVVSAMGMKPWIIKRWAVENESVLEKQGIASRRAGIIQAFVKMLRMTSMMGVMTVAAIQIVDPTSGLSRGAMMASVILVGRCLMPIEGLVGGWDGVRAAIESYRSIAAALADSAKTIKETVTPADPKALIEVQNVIYHPRGLPRAVLNRINFTLEPGKALGIIGPSASGKSSLARLMVGVEKPTHGYVRLDGVDIHSWSSDELGEYVGYLPQDVELFSGTVRENISRFDPDARSEDLIRAAELAGIHKMIQSFPNGYETDIGSHGALLSGGQRQRVGLARALYGNVKYVVLDEPNANLDVSGEQALVGAIEAMKERGVTVITILHRPNILKNMDYIMVLREGVIQKFAPTNEVLPLFDASANQDKVEDNKVTALPS